MRLVRPSQICACSGESRRGFLPKRMRSIRSGSGIHLAHNSAKLKIINLPKHYPVVKVRERTFGSLWRNLSVSLSVLRFALPAVRWSVSPWLTDQRNDGAADAKWRLDLAEPPFAQHLRSLGALRPDIQFALRCSWPEFLPPRFTSVVETRRLELLTLSLQRRCSAN